MNIDENTAATSSGAPFATAAGTPASSAIYTDALDLVAADVVITTQGKEMPAYMAHPAGKSTPMPIVLVIQEIFGVHEHIRDICRRLAKQGYMAIAPELFFRQGDASGYDDIPTLMQQLVSKVPDPQVLADLDHTAHWAARHGGDGGRLAATGFCWGGRIAWLYAAHNPQLKAAVAWYGKLAGDKSLSTPRHPVDVVKELIAPVLGLYGAQDGSITIGHIQAMRNALTSAGKTVAEIVVYPEAGHAFYADYRASYHASSAQDGWRRMLAWFDAHGVK